MRIIHNAVRPFLIVCVVAFSLATLPGCGGSGENTTVFDSATEEQIQAAMERDMSEEEEAALAKVEEQLED